MALGTLGYFQELIDLFISGMNAGLNLAHEVAYSGTVTAVRGTLIAGVPGIVVLLEMVDGHIGDVQYGPPACTALKIVRR